MKSLFRFLKRGDAAPPPAAVSQPDDVLDHDAVITYTSPARAGESLVISQKLMEAQLSIVQGMTALLADPDEALAAFERAGTLLVDYRGPIDQNTVDLMAEGATWLLKLGDSSRSIALFERAIDGAARERALACDSLSDKLIQVGALLATGALPRVRAIMERALALHRDRYGARHQRSAAILYIYAGLVEASGDLPSAGALYREVANVRQAALGEEHEDTLKAYDAVARSCLQLDQVDEAIERAEQTRAIRERVRGPNDISIAESLEIVGMGLKRKGDLPSAEVMLRRALAIVHAAGPEEEAKSGILLSNLATVLLMMQRFDEALPVLHRALALKEDLVGPDSPSVGHTLFQLANLYASMGEFKTARPLAQRSSANYSAALGATHPDAQRARGLLEQIEHDMKRTGQL